MDVDLTQCLGGDKAAWDAFVEHYSGAIYAAVLRTLRQHPVADMQHLAEDTAQDVFLRLVKDDYRLLRSFDANRSSLTTWLTIVARSTAIDRLRQQREPAAPLEVAQGIPAPTTDPAQDAEAAGGSALRQVPEGLLSARQRLVLTLIFDKQMDVPAIARLIGVDEQTVRSTKHKALERLRKHLGER